MIVNLLVESFLLGRAKTFKDGDPAGEAGWEKRCRDVIPCLDRIWPALCKVLAMLYSD